MTVLNYEKRKSTGAYYIQLGVFPAYFGFTIGYDSTYKELSRLLKNKAEARRIADELKECGGYTLQLDADSGSLTILIGLNAELERGSIATAGTIVHECVHAWDLLNEYIKGDQSCSEMNAYHIQAMSETLFEIYGKEMLSEK